MKALLSSKYIQEAREGIKEDMAKGQTIKEELLKATRITESIVIKVGSLHFNNDVFEAFRNSELLHAFK